MHNSDNEISIKTLGDININKFWAQIVGETPYVARSAKATRIQNPILKYI